MPPPILENRHDPPVREGLNPVGLRVAVLSPIGHHDDQLWRQGQQMTQVALGEALHMVQSNVSRIERQRDLRVSTLTAYLWALGADEVTLQVHFPDHEPVVVPLDTLAS